METAFTVLAYVIAAWLAVGLIVGICILIGMWKESRK